LVTLKLLSAEILHVEFFCELLVSFAVGYHFMRDFAPCRGVHATFNASHPGQQLQNGSGPVFKVLTAYFKTTWKLNPGDALFFGTQLDIWPVAFIKNKKTKGDRK